MQAPWHNAVSAARAATMFTPGAEMSGLRTPSIRGPKLVKIGIGQSSARLADAPTVRAASATPGVATLRPGPPLLPAAITNRAPVAAVRLLTAWLIGSVPSLRQSGGPQPRLIETMSASCSWAAHSMPAITAEVGQPPPSSQTLPTSRSAPGATPWYWPPDAAPDPAMVEATWVP